MSDWPELREELERKAVETVLHLQSRHEEGELTDAELKASVNAIFDVISGLVSWEIADLIYAVRKELESA